ncbi:MAG: hypothetical protein MUC48_27320 [Leptolyngbya sp. Prado105]|jgi:hypothetical protein|nr:hypothetical protein [Leptolyngbya sp. Prado105]
MMLEKQLVGFLDSLADILYCLRSDRLPECFTLSQLGNMRLKFCTIQMLSAHPVVPFVKCNAMVINHPGGIDAALKVFIPTALIELKLQRFHCTVYHLDIPCNEKKHIFSTNR